MKKIALVIIFVFIMSSCTFLILASSGSGSASSTRAERIQKLELEKQEFINNNKESTNLNSDGIDKAAGSNDDLAAKKKH